MDTDFLLILLRELVARNKAGQGRTPPLKVILMSATLDAAKFAAYFYGAPVFSVKGFTHPVTEFFLDEVLRLTGYAISQLQ